MFLYVSFIVVHCPPMFFPIILLVDIVIPCFPPDFFMFDHATPLMVARFIMFSSQVSSWLILLFHLFSMFDHIFLSILPCFSQVSSLILLFLYVLLMSSPVSLYPSLFLPVDYVFPLIFSEGS